MSQEEQKPTGEQNKLSEEQLKRRVELKLDVLKVLISGYKLADSSDRSEYDKALRQCEEKKDEIMTEPSSLLKYWLLAYLTELIYYINQKKEDKNAAENALEEFSKQKEYFVSELTKEYITNEQIIKILSILLCFSWDIKSKPLAHYTTPTVSELLLGFDKSDNKPKYSGNNQNAEHPNNTDDIKASPLRLNSATYMNDPLEGKCLEKYLNILENHPNSKLEITGKKAFLTSLSLRINDLNQFRLYGKEHNVEASGVCLVFNNLINDYDTENYFKNRNSEETNPKEIKIPIYQVAYLKTDREKITAHLPKDEDNLLHKKREEELNTSLNKLKADIQKDPNFDLSQLEYIKFLFKDIAFKDEEELRLLRIEDIKSDKIELCEYTNNLYINYRDITSLVDEVILGTNFEKTEEKRKNEVYAYYINKLNQDKKTNIKVYQSTLPINPNK